MVCIAQVTPEDNGFNFINRSRSYRVCIRKGIEILHDPQALYDAVKQASENVRRLVSLKTILRNPTRKPKVGGQLAERLASYEEHFAKLVAAGQACSEDEVVYHLGDDPRTFNCVWSGP